MNCSLHEEDPSTKNVYAETLPTDKAMHCYVGCTIGLATNLKITDYDPTTHFEDAGSIATSRGARLGARSLRRP